MAKQWKSILRQNTDNMTSNTRTHSDTRTFAADVCNEISDVKTSNAKTNDHWRYIRKWHKIASKWSRLSVEPENPQTYTHYHTRRCTAALSILNRNFCHIDLVWCQLSLYLCLTSFTIYKKQPMTKVRKYTRWHYSHCQVKIQYLLNSNVPLPIFPSQSTHLP